MTPYTPEEIALAHTLAYRAVPERLRHQARAAAYRGALLGIRATTERAAKWARANAEMSADSDDDFIRGAENASIAIATDFENNHHLKDRPDAG